MESIHLGSMYMGYTNHWVSEPEHNLDPNEIIIQEKSIDVYFSYPFFISKIFTFSTINGLGFTRREFSELILKKYRELYQDKSLGIFGHALTDLLLSGARKHPIGYYTLEISS